jgi:hypothetical protein
LEYWVLELRGKYRVLVFRVLVLGFVKYYWVLENGLMGLVFGSSGL